MFFGLIAFIVDLSTLVCFAPARSQHSDHLWLGSRTPTSLHRFGQNPAQTVEPRSFADVEAASRDRSAGLRGRSFRIGRQCRSRSDLAGCDQASCVTRQCSGEGSVPVPSPVPSSPPQPPPSPPSLWSVTSRRFQAEGHTPVDLMISIWRSATWAPFFVVLQATLRAVQTYASGVEQGGACADLARQTCPLQWKDRDG